MRLALPDVHEVRGLELWKGLGLRVEDNLRVYSQ